jgi:flagellar assembly protein FliH
MNRRVNLGRSVVVPWQIPEIDGAARHAEAPDFLEMALGRVALDAAPTVLEPAPIPPRNSEPVLAGTVDRDPGKGHAEGLELGRREGREQGYAEGFAHGQRDAEAQSAEQLNRLEAIVRRLGEPMRTLERPVEEAVIALALEVARWVIGGEIAHSRDYLVRLVRDAVGKVPIDVGRPTLVLNPADADLLRALAPDLESNGIPLVADETVEPGGCLVFADGAEGVAVKDRRWHPRARQGICEVDLTLASRWRDAMFAMFEGEDA